MAGRLNAADVLLGHAGEASLRAQPAILQADRSVSYGELAQLSARVANTLRAAGLEAGDRLCMLMDDSPMFCATFLGALKAGLVAVPVNTRLAPNDVSFILRDSEARLVIYDPAHASLAAQAAGDRTRLQAARGGPGSLEALACDAAPMQSSHPTGEDEVAFWLYSSGTTGRPKAILHSHANASRAGKLLREVASVRPGTVILATSKLFFAFALDNAFTGALACGATTILNEDWPEPEAIAAQVERHRPGVFFTVPTFFRRLLALPKQALAPFSRIPIVATGGERLPDAILRQWRNAVGTEILVCYGMSETFCNAISNFPGRTRDGSTGVPLAGVQTRIVDNAGAEVAPSEPGVLWLRHPSLALGYKDPAATAQAFRDGWFCTGDLFTRDADGYFYHQGRSDELYKVAGQWVRPAELEEAVLLDENVREAACVVVPDRDGFDRLALFVVPRDALGAAAIAAERRAAAMPKHSRPKWIREVTELPRTATGKIQRFRLRAQLSAELRSAP
jgi:benzoate-CoA ligase